MLKSLQNFFAEWDVDDMLGQYVFEALSDQGGDREIEDHGGQLCIWSLRIEPHSTDVYSAAIQICGTFRNHLGDKDGVGYDAYVSFSFTLNAKLEDGKGVRITGDLRAHSFYDPLEQTTIEYDCPRPVGRVSTTVREEDFGADYVFDRARIRDARFEQFLKSTDRERILEMFKRKGPSSP